jgi:hypothetical protein
MSETEKRKSLYKFKTEMRMKIMRGEIDELKKSVESLEKLTRVNLIVDGGLDDGKRQTVTIPVLLQAILNKLNIRPVFKREIEFVNKDNSVKKETERLVGKAACLVAQVSQIGMKLTDDEKRKVKEAVMERTEDPRSEIIIAGDRIFIKKENRSLWHRLTRKDYCLKEVK